MNTLCSDNRLFTDWRLHFIKVRIIPVFFLPLILLVSCKRTDKAYYPDGKPEFNIPKDIRGRINGEAIWWYENGSPMLTAEYKNGELNGKLTRFFENGNKQTEDSYLQGKLDGLSFEMDRNGKVMSEMTYSNDTLNGPCRKFNELGQVLEEGNYKDGYFEGKWNYYDRFGKLIGNADFNHGSGIRKSWNADGRIAMTTEYHNNLVQGDETWYDESGRKIRVRKYMSGEIVSETIIPPNQQ